MSRPTPPPRIDGAIQLPARYARAAQLADFSAAERFVLLVAEEAWYLADRPISLAEVQGLADRLDLFSDDELRRAHSDLLFCEVLEVAGRTTSQINFDVERWSFADDRPRFTPEQLAWIDGGAA